MLFRASSSDVSPSLQTMSYQARRPGRRPAPYALRSLLVIRRDSSCGKLRYPPASSGHRRSSYVKPQLGSRMSTPCQVAVSCANARDIESRPIPLRSLPPSRIVGAGKRPSHAALRPATPAIRSCPPSAESTATGSASTSKDATRSTGPSWCRTRCASGAIPHSVSSTAARRSTRKERGLARDSAT